MYHNMDAMLIAMIVTGILTFLMWLLAEWTFRHPGNDSEKNKERK